MLQLTHVMLAVLGMLSPVSRDMTVLYPGPAATIEGWNYSTDPPSYSALHFSQHPGWWEQSNSADGCHHDTFVWGSVLEYVATHDECGPVVQDTIYATPIVLMPARWDEKPWTRTGRSTVSDYANAEGRCRGFTDWRSDVVGYEHITPDEVAVHVSTYQETTWTNGPCAPYVTKWREDYYFTDHLRRSVGGNLNGAFSWDVWFDR